MSGGILSCHHHDGHHKMLTYLVDPVADAQLPVVVTAPGEHLAVLRQQTAKVTTTLHLQTTWGRGQREPKPML